MIILWVYICSANNFTYPVHWWEIKIRVIKSIKVNRELNDILCALELWYVVIFVSLNKSGYGFLFGQTNFDRLETHVFKDIL